MSETQTNLLIGGLLVNIFLCIGIVGFVDNPDDWIKSMGFAALTGLLGLLAKTYSDKPQEVIDVNRRDGVPAMVQVVPGPDAPVATTRKRRAPKAQPVPVEVEEEIHGPT